jgi:hypothetical protein
MLAQGSFGGGRAGPDEQRPSQGDAPADAARHFGKFAAFRSRDRAWNTEINAHQPCSPGMCTMSKRRKLPASVPASAVTRKADRRYSAPDSRRPASLNPSRNASLAFR